MRPIFVLFVGLVLGVSACNSQEPADTESLSVPEVTTGNPADVGVTAAPESDSTSGSATVTSSMHSLSVGDEVTLSAAGFDGEVEWGASDGIITSDGTTARFTPPGRLGDYVVTARVGSQSVATTVSVDHATVYASDFSIEPGTEWDEASVAISPSGEQFLGEFGTGQRRLWLQGLPTHDEVTIEFDLYILKSWDGLAGRDSWEMQINDSQVISTTFSNDEKRQTWPDNFPYGDNPGRSGATSTDSLGYFFREEGNPADATYHVERTFNHEGAVLWVDFVGHELDGIEDESWGLDNVAVTIHRTPRGVDRPATELVVAITPGHVSVTGQVPDPTIESIIRQAATDWFEASTLDVELVPIEDTITPLWLPRLADILYELRDARTITLSVDRNTAILDGGVSTDRYRKELVGQLTRRLGYPVLLVDQTEDAVAPTVVDEVEALTALFSVGSPELDEDASGILDRVVTILSDSPDMAVYVVGHTDLTGTEQKNSDLSWERARAAVAYLVGRGVSEDQLRTHSEGSGKPAEDGTSAEANAANRRVVFWVVDR